jgi:putative aminopeptidase FrvX
MASPYLLDASLDLLWELLEQDSPAGDEGPLADWLETWLKRSVPDASVERLGDMLLVTRGIKPSVAVFAHLDTTGWTLGYDKRLIRIGGPDGKSGDPIRPVGQPNAGNTLARRKDGSWKVKGETKAALGSRWVYAAVPELSGGEIRGPYLDNRAGVWAALHALTRCPEIAVALTVQEEIGSLGAHTCARRLFETYGIRQALIADLTWDTKHIKHGHGAAISLRDSSLPRQRFLDRVLALAEASGLPFQREVESSGGSDGGGIDRSGVPMDWVFVGAPEKAPHTARERAHVGDLQGMVTMLVYLVDGLSYEPLPPCFAGSLPC